MAFTSRHLRVCFMVTLLLTEKISYYAADLMEEMSCDTADLMV